ncbi:MAG: chlorophyll synthase ChlG [Pseudomonadota bacterium]
MRESSVAGISDTPFWASALELLKPVTWFPPMWAFACGIIAANVAIVERLPFFIGGVLLAGPFICGTSQVVNDYFDRHVDAINEPHRPIPSGRISSRTALIFALVWTGLSLLLSAALGIWVLAAGALGLALAWAYSAPPFRLKRNGWFGNSAVGLCYEGLPWFTAVAVMTAALPDTRNIAVLILYSLGAHGIMTLNDFKSIDGDRAMGLKSLPVLLGAERAARFACLVMLAPQVVVALVLWQWGAPIFAMAVAGVSLAQCLLMPRLLSDPLRFAPWYNATGIVLYVSGMMVSAFALRSLAA